MYNWILGLSISGESYHKTNPNLSSYYTDVEYMVLFSVQEAVKSSSVNPFLIYSTYR